MAGQAARRVHGRVLVGRPLHHGAEWHQVRRKSRQKIVSLCFNFLACASAHRHRLQILPYGCHHSWQRPTLYQLSS